MAGREHASGHMEGDGRSGVFACDGDVQAHPPPPRGPRASSDRTQIHSYLQRHARAVRPAFCSWSHLQPWTVTQALCWRKLRFSNHRLALQSSSVCSWRSFLLTALTRGASGPALKPQILKKNVKPLELLILLNHINTHFKGISSLLPLKHVLVLFSTLNT